MCLLYQERASDLMGEDPLTRYKRNYLIWFASSCLFSLPPILSAGLFSGHWCDWPFNQPFTEKRSACGTSLLKTSLRLLHYIRYIRIYGRSLWTSVQLMLLMLRCFSTKEGSSVICHFTNRSVCYMAARSINHCHGQLSILSRDASLRTARSMLSGRPVTLW